MNKGFHGRLGEAGLGFILCSLSLYKKVHSKRSQRFSDYLKSFQTIRTGFLQEFYLHYKGIQDTCNTVGKLRYIYMRNVTHCFLFLSKTPKCFYFYVVLFNVSYFNELQVFYFSRMCLWDKWVDKCSECTRAFICLIVSKLIWKL